MAQVKFAELMKKYMQREDSNDDDLARQLKLRRETIFRWRTGGIKSPKCDKVKKCAQILRLNPIERHEFLMAAGCPDPDAKPPALTPEEQNTTTNNGSNMPDNDGPVVPATTTRPIIHPAQFFGREDQLERIFGAWKHVPLEHVAVVGPKRSGKTSLLNYLRFIHNEKKLRDRQRHDWIKQEYNWVFVDFDNVHMRRPESFLRCVLKELQLPNDKSDDWTELAEILEDNIKKPTVILMDNIEIGLQLPDLDEQFWGHMRSLGNNISKLGFCVTSRKSLDELEKLAEELNKPSPLINVFGDIELGPLTEAEARELLGCTSLSKADAEWILENSQCWPVLLQVLCRIRLESEEGEDWKKEGLEKIERYPDLLDSSQ